MFTNNKYNETNSLTPVSLTSTVHFSFKKIQLFFCSLQYVWSEQRVWFSDNSSLVLMRALVKDEGDCSIPRCLQHRISQASLISTVMPVGQIAGAVWVFRWKVYLSTVYTAPAAKPDQNISNNSLMQKCQTLVRLETIYEHSVWNNHSSSCYLSCVSLTVSSLSEKSSRSSPREKCLSTSCSSSTTQLLRAFLWACLCKIFSSMVPV